MEAKTQQTNSRRIHCVSISIDVMGRPQKDSDQISSNKTRQIAHFVLHRQLQSYDER